MLNLELILSHNQTNYEKRINANYQSSHFFMQKFIFQFSFFIICKKLNILKL